MMRPLTIASLCLQQHGFLPVKSVLLTIQAVIWVGNYVNRDYIRWNGGVAPSRPPQVPPTRDKQDLGNCLTVINSRSGLANNLDSEMHLERLRFDFGANYRKIIISYC